MKIPFNSFATGEIDASLSARYDLAKYKPACKLMKNFLVEVHGNARRRPGTYFLEDLGADAVLLPFQFSSDPSQCLILVFTNLKLRFANASGFLVDGLDAVIEVTTPYTTTQLLEISAAQSGDVVYLAHRSHALRKLSRLSTTSWTLTTPTFAPSIAAPTGVTVGFVSGPTGGATVAPADYTLRYRVAATSASGEVSVASASGATATARHPSDWIAGDKVNLSWGAVAGAVEYFIYREEGGYFGLVGVSTTTSFIDVKYVAATSKTPLIQNNPFANDNHPGLVGFHEQRLILAGAAKFPQTVYGSMTANFEGFFKRAPLQEDDAFEHTVASGSIDAINWLASFGDLLVGTGSAEHQLTGGGSGDAITPSNVQIKAQSYWGSTQIPPLVIGNSVMHVQKQGSHVRDLFFSLEKDGYAGNDLTILAPHLFEGYTLRQWTYQQAPGSVVWCVRNDGALLALTYMKEHDIWAWSQHSTEGEYRSVCSITGEFEDQLFCVVKRTVNGATKYFLELMLHKWIAEEGIEEAFFVDCGLSYYGAPATVISGLGHLEGKSVAVLAEGSPVESLTVTGGSITLPYPASTVHVGLPYQSILAPMPFEADTKDGTTLGRLRTVGLSRIRVLDTVGGRYGSSPGRMDDFPYLPDDWGAAVAPYSGDLEFSPDTEHTSQTTVYIEQERPLPMTIVALMLDVSYEG